MLIALIIDQHSFTSEDFLPMLSYIDVKCSIENQLMVESDISNFQREELKAKFERNKTKMDKVATTPIVNRYFKAIESQSAIKISPFLASLIKEFVDGLTMPLIKERSVLKA